jgi:hypothetical protein
MAFTGSQKALDVLPPSWIIIFSELIGLEK